ncbi:cob(I)yrinic acid a,c-diamide adenosyltransferase [Prochlorococcus sp. MIT 1307]|uniref:cob(I)yrinic acid a,c-diamide adenosyltransferase n=1 Tax=Prochlorococcus sp. MIT 1307 TaxID=3096219 RepID=UPI002A7569B8|nr:cob(I)yrinic acid a,c-diamide adenosyltransferase [Prochlorococcus sp. MIT 1307]
MKDLDQHAIEIGMGGHLGEQINEDGYRKKMKRRKEVQRKRLEKRQEEKGLTIIFSGNGKGKTTAALGMALRTLGHGKRAAIIQFIKGGWQPGEAMALKIFGESISWHALGEGFTWETQDRERDKKLVSKAWEMSLHYLQDEIHSLVILDEINIAIKLGYLSLEDVLQGLNNKPPMKHVVLTGRGAKQELIDHADLVTEMKLVRHPFKEKGIKAQAGVEF